MKPIDRFIKKVKIADSGCWEWQGALGGGSYKKGIYGAFWYEGKTVSASRWIYSYVHNKQLNKDAQICHHCDNPSCVNPSHLFEGNVQDNIDDRNIKNRQAKGEKHGGAKLTEQDVIEIRSNRINSKIMAKKYNVHRDTIHKIRSGNSWKHLNKKGPVKGLSHCQTKV